jgi:hypothetical protein
MAKKKTVQYFQSQSYEIIMLADFHFCHILLGASHRFSDIPRKERQKLQNNMYLQSHESGHVW